MPGYPTRPRLWGREGDWGRSARSRADQREEGDPLHSHEGGRSFRRLLCFSRGKRPAGRTDVGLPFSPCSPHSQTTPSNQIHPPPPPQFPSTSIQTNSSRPTNFSRAQPLVFSPTLPGSCSSSPLNYHSPQSSLRGRFLPSFARGLTSSSPAKQPTPLLASLIHLVHSTLLSPCPPPSLPLPALLRPIRRRCAPSGHPVRAPSGRRRRPRLLLPPAQWTPTTATARRPSLPPTS